MRLQLLHSSGHLHSCDAAQSRPAARYEASVHQLTGLVHPAVEVDEVDLAHRPGITGALPLLSAT